MDVINKELDIPKRQISEVVGNRYLVFAHKLWVKSLAHHGSISQFVEAQAEQLHEWPSDTKKIGDSWQQIFITVHQKRTHKVVPLPRFKTNNELDNSTVSSGVLPITYSQLTSYVSQSNHKSLWKHAYHKYSASHQSTSNNSNLTSGTNAQSKHLENISSINLSPYDSVLRETITRIYGCKIIQYKCRINEDDLDSNHFEPHHNIYPAIAAIETDHNFFVIHDALIDKTLLDCVTYSPAILDDFNKPLFLIYQLLNLIKALHERGLLLGEINLHDIYLTENLWLQILPKLDVNVVEYQDQICTSQEYNNFKANLVNEVEVSYTLRDYCEMWIYGQLSNFDYLTILNNLAGRRIGCPGNHHIMPWVSDFTSRNGLAWRDLSKSKYRLNKGDAQLDITFQPTLSNIPHHVSDVLSEITYYVYLSRRTPKSILCKHVRPVWVPGEYPTSMQRLFDWSPDECIPEFFTDPQVFKSIHEDLPNLQVPAWSSSPEDFVNKHRELLESQYVSERLHQWIDLTFGYKLSGAAAVKSKNVCLPLVDKHKNLCKRGIVQLFFSHHPARQFSNAWSQKVPPRIRSLSESRQQRRMTRSSEDLTRGLDIPSTSIEAGTSSRSRKSVTPHSESIERSPSCYQVPSNSNPNRDTIILPKNYNPISQITALENLESFKMKTFYENIKKETLSNDEKLLLTEDDALGFTNRLFSETYEAELIKDSKMILNIQQKIYLEKHAKKTFKQITIENRVKDLQTLGVLIMEIFVPGKMRAHGSCSRMSFEQRVRVCKNLIRNDLKSIPGCVQYTLQLLFGILDTYKDESNPLITDKGLPLPNAELLLEPILSQTFLPFPIHYYRVYSIMKMLYSFSSVGRMLDIYTFYECDGQCQKYETLDKTRIAISRKLAECKVKSAVALIEDLLQPSGSEIFTPVQLLLPHVIDLINDDETSILATWYLFDIIATALGPADTQNYLLTPILSLYESENERTTFLQTSDISMRFVSNTNFKSRKTVKLYHHSFLLKLIVRFGLKCFLDNFVSPLIEAVGGYKDPQINHAYHVHHRSDTDIRPSRSINKNLRFTENDKSDATLISPEGSDEKTLSALSPSILDGPATTGSAGDVFIFESESPVPCINDETDVDNSNIAIQKILDQLDIKSETGSFDLKLNYSTAFEVTEDACPDNLSHDSDITTDDLEKASFMQSPTIPIPTATSSFHYSRELNSIGCEIGSKKSIDSIDVFSQNLCISKSNTVPETNQSEILFRDKDESMETSLRSNIDVKSNTRSMRISDMSSESLLWLSHRLGPVLSARYLTRNLLKMLTLCYVGHENLIPENNSSLTDPSTITSFSILDSRVVGDISASNVLECLSSIAVLFGEQFILLQYFPHISELIALCRRRITPTLEGGLISALQLLKHLIPCLSDSQLMDQLIDVILGNIIHPVIRIIGSSRTTMPSGFLARSVLTRKLVDALYLIAIRIGPEITNKQLCVPALQRFFLIFDKAYEVYDSSRKTASDSNWISQDDIPTFPSTSTDDNNYVEIRRDGKMKEWHIKGTEIHSSIRDRDTLSNVSPPVDQNKIFYQQPVDSDEIRKKALDEIKDVFTPALAFGAYKPFLNYLGETIMEQTVVNYQLIATLCLELEQLDYWTLKSDKRKLESTTIEQSFSGDDEILDPTIGNNFGSNVAVIGNRIDVQTTVCESDKSENKLKDVIDMVAYKYANVNSARHLRGNWLAYWEHEIGRPDKDVRFNLKQIKLQTYSGHVNSVRAIVCLDNENSFMSASKDKTVKLWSLRSEGDGTKISSCQFTYTNHKKSVHSLAFLESLRLTVSCDSGVHIWDPFVGSSVGYFDAPRYSPVTIVRTFPSPSSIVIAGTSESTLRMIDARSFTYINEWKLTPSLAGSVRSIAVAPSGNQIAAGLSSGQIVLLDSRTGYIISSWRCSDNELLQLVAPNDNQLISSCLDSHIAVWSAKDGSFMHNLRSPPEPAHCLVTNGIELMCATPANRIGNYSSFSGDSLYTFTKLRSEVFRGVLTSIAALPLNRMLLIGSDNGNINLLC